MSVLLKPNGTGNQKETDRFGVNTRKMERTGENTFVVKADGGNYFEGKITNPNAVKFKDSGRIYITNVGVCLKKCLNRDKACSNCFRFSELKEVK